LTVEEEEEAAGRHHATPLQPADKGVPFIGLGAEEYESPDTPMPENPNQPEFTPFQMPPNFDGDPPGDWKLPPLRPGHGSRMCCVKRWTYPEGRPKPFDYKHPTALDEWTIYVRGFFFWFGATYLENSDCACNCCLFKQFVRRNINNNSRGRNEQTRGYPGYQEDCMILDSNRNQVAYTAERAPRPEAGETVDCNSGTWNSMSRLNAVGRPSGESPYKPSPAGGGEIAGGFWQTRNSCSWENGDFPFVAANWSWGKWDITWDFLGVIYDQCRNYKIERMTQMSLSIHGEGVQATSRKAVRTPIVPPGATTTIEYDRLPGLTGAENKLVRDGVTRQVDANR
jgi:hypothetical protein